MTQLEINIGGIQVLSRGLSRWVDQIHDLQPALEAVAHQLVAANKENFDSEGAAGSFGQWAPLSPAYAAWKAQKFPGRPILVRTGKLKHALTEFPMQVQQNSATNLRLGTDIFYARFHQTGTPNMPRRAPVALTETMRREMVKTIQRYIAQAGKMS